MALAVAVCGCGKGVKSDKAEVEHAKERITSYAPKFDADSAYAYVKAQVDMGIRVPGTPGHEECEAYIIDKLKEFDADTIIVQRANVTAFNGDVLPIANIMAQFKPECKRRVLLVAHYDTRPWADNEPSDKNRQRPILGANDGGSGTGVLLEIARQLGDIAPEIGVDLLFVDAEDYGDSSGWDRKESSWGLGTQYWVENMPYTSSNMPEYGIVLDMVGGTDAKFHREYYSHSKSRNIVDKVWGTAAKTGFGDVFVNEVGGSLIDDHVFINRAGIPCIDIVECNNAVTHSFPPTWHTLSDTMTSIDKKSLNAAGQTVLNVLFEEKDFR